MRNTLGKLYKISENCQELSRTVKIIKSKGSVTIITVEKSQRDTKNKKYPGWSAGMEKGKLMKYKKIWSSVNINGPMLTY